MILLMMTIAQTHVAYMREREIYMIIYETRMKHMKIMIPRNSNFSIFFFGSLVILPARYNGLQSSVSTSTTLRFWDWYSSFMISWSHWRIWGRWRVLRIMSDAMTLSGVYCGWDESSLHWTFSGNNCFI